MMDMKMFVKEKEYQIHHEPCDNYQFGNERIY